jgi:elongation factor Ts
MVNTAELIKKLREATQAGMMDCRKALEENNFDFDKSVQWLREKGIAKAAKKADAIASEGICRAVLSKTTVYIFELNCQTDFTAKTADFVAIADGLSKFLSMSGEAFDQVSIQKVMINSTQTLEQACINATARIGEKIYLRRISSINLKKDQTAGIYNHSNHRISAVTILSNVVNQEISNNISMHVAAMNPKFLNRTFVEQSWLENEKKILIEQTLAEGKPKEFAEKIVTGRVNKLLAENCLVDQPYVKEPSLKVSEYAKKSNSEVTMMVRYEVGEGIVKETVDFAKEVEAQMKAVQK